jgi:hypothetical protein
MTVADMLADYLRKYLPVDRLNNLRDRATATWDHIYKNLPSMGSARDYINKNLPSMDKARDSVLSAANTIYDNATWDKILGALLLTGGSAALYRALRRRSAQRKKAAGWFANGFDDPDDIVISPGMQQTLFAVAALKTASERGTNADSVSANADPGDFSSASNLWLQYPWDRLAGALLLTGGSVALLRALARHQAKSRQKKKAKTTDLSRFYY